MPPDRSGFPRQLPHSSSSCSATTWHARIFLYQPLNRQWFPGVISRQGRAPVGAGNFARIKAKGTYTTRSDHRLAEWPSGSRRKWPSGLWWSSDLCDHHCPRRGADSSGRKVRQHAN